jgi:hypothetical protein
MVEIPRHNENLARRVLAARTAEVLRILTSTRAGYGQNRCM